MTGAGAAWNARAEFPAASTLKLAIAVETLRSLHGKPAPGSYADSLLHRALIYSDNGAANDLEVLYAGSTHGGSAGVNALMRQPRPPRHGDVRRLRARARRQRSHERVDEQPYYGIGKHTSAYDLAQLFGFVHLATAGKGPLAKRYGSAFTPSDARYLLYLARPLGRPRQARPLRRRSRRLGPAQGRLDHERAARRRARLLARRRVRGQRDDVRLRRRHGLRRPGGPRRATDARPAVNATSTYGRRPELSGSASTSIASSRAVAATARSAVAIESPAPAAASKKQSAIETARSFRS